MSLLYWSVICVGKFLLLSFQLRLDLPSAGLLLTVSCSSQTVVSWLLLAAAASKTAASNWLLLQSAGYEAHLEMWLVSTLYLYKLLFS